MAANWRSSSPAEARRYRCGWVITGGEALTGEHLQRIRQAFAPQQVFNAYGPTETVVMPLACLAPQTVPSDAGSVPIGRVVGARTGYILDEDLALLPQGGIGELYIGGAGLAQGYHDRADIELGEIESCLQRHPDVEQAVVLALDLPGGKQLVGYLVCPQATAGSEAQAHLRETVKVHHRDLHSFPTRRSSDL